MKIDKTDENDAVIFSKLFSTELDRVLISKINNGLVSLEDYTIASKCELEEVEIKRILNYIECGIIESKLKNIHTNDFVIGASFNEKFCLRLSETGKITFDLLNI